MIDPVDSGAIPVEAGPLSSTCSVGQSNACSCPADTEGGASKLGTQGCYQGEWLVCNCQTIPDAGPVSTTGECKAGRYEGNFMGDYRSGFALGGGLKVSALDLTGMPGLAFTLYGKEEGGGEFKEFVVSDGYVKGTANGTFPFEGVLTGTLDCPTKTFKGTLKGHYCLLLCGGFNEGFFEGPITGTYDGTSFSFTGGTWDLIEPAAMDGLLGMIGGNGTWDAQWKHDVDPDAAVVVPFDAAAFETDAGTAEAGAPGN